MRAWSSFAGRCGRPLWLLCLWLLMWWLPAAAAAALVAQLLASRQVLPMLRRWWQRQAPPMRKRRSLLTWAAAWSSLWMLSACGTAPSPVWMCPPLPAELLMPAEPPVLLEPGSASRMPGTTTPPTPRPATASV